MEEYKKKEEYKLTEKPNWGSVVCKTKEERAEEWVIDRFNWKFESDNCDCQYASAINQPKAFTRKIKS